MLNALILDDDPASRFALAELVELEGFSTAVAGSLAEAREKINEQIPDVALVDLFLPDGNGLKIVEQLHAHVATEVVLITGNASVDSAVHALRMGAADYLTKPVDFLRVRTVLANVARTRELKREISSLRGALIELGRFGPLIGASVAMQEVYDLIEKAAPSGVSVLLTGESGTGKEEVATAIHRLSRRSRGPFFPVNCGAISPNLIESELFGHEKGSFTGAHKRRGGFFELAAGGTLFLDEITEMPIELQVKLLRVLETGRFFRIGGEEPLQTDVRLVAATNRDPEEAVAAGKLRQDLLYRISVFRIRLPPLRERENDVDLLADHFLGQMNAQERAQKRFTPAFVERLRSYSWPGNVRELKNVVQRAYIVGNEEIGPESLPPEIAGALTGDSAGGIYLKVGMPIAEAERRLILATLEQCEGDKKRAAQILGVSLKTLYNRLNSYEKKSKSGAAA